MIKIFNLTTHCETVTKLINKSCEPLMLMNIKQEKSKKLQR